MEKIKNTVVKMAHNKSPGLDGIIAEFYQHYWDLIKCDLKEMFYDFHKGELDIKRLKYGIITLVPKSKDANQIQKYRPICLMNVSFKIFNKILMNRLNMVAGGIISPVQTAFVKGRYIMEGVMILHEPLNSVHRKKENALLFKVDFEKA